MAKSKPLSEASKDVKGTLKKLDVLGVEYRGLKEMEKERDARMDEIKAVAKPLVQELGKDDGKGSIELDTGLLTFRLQRKERVSINEMEAMILLEKKGLVEQATKLVVDPEKVRDLFANDELDEADLAVILASKISHDFMTPALTADKKGAD